MQPGWCQPVRQEFMENECEALPGVAYPGVRDNRTTLNTKTGYDDDGENKIPTSCLVAGLPVCTTKQNTAKSLTVHLNQLCEIRKDDIDDLPVNGGVRTHRPVEDKIHHLQLAYVRSLGVEQL